MRTTSISFLLALSIGTLAWGSTQIYATYCVPGGFNGWVQSFITSSSAPCQAILTLITNTSTLYATMIGALFVGVFSAAKEGIHSLLYPSCTPEPKKCE
jgi:hypothetical protein